VPYRKVISSIRGAEKKDYSSLSGRSRKQENKKITLEKVTTQNIG
jgi:hypothetical protein